ncbi:hypothetical protein [Desulfobulbus sp.]|uniref:hypothetical protein n=1 Tax=Desulfobulbus sp. TaxID=895 RepID=UPI00286F1309|nr:hypothetical protein [Desulfobulbus sp.]
MKTIRHLPLVVLMVAYSLVFLAQEKLFLDRPVNLQPIPTASFLRATTGYLRQLTSEILFVQSSVFLGGVEAGTDPNTYAPALAHNYQQITTLYPQFIDPYYFAQANLSNVSPEMAQATNDILITAKKAYPTDLIYPFFQGFNLFRYLDKPLEAAEVFRQASLLPEAPPMFSRLAAILTAQGGQLHAAIISLQVMVRTTDDERIKKRCYKEMEMFRQALKVQKAVNDFYTDHHRYPGSLDELVPGFLPALPTFGDAFVLTWNPPNVGLKRPYLAKTKPSAPLSHP